MGLPNSNRFRITDHAKMRYLERINAKATNEQMLKDFRTIMQGSSFLSKENAGRESWFYPTKNIVLILDTFNYKVITIYSSLKEAEMLKNNMNEDGVCGIDCEVESEKETEYSLVEKTISNFADEWSLSVSRKYYSELANLYAEYAERMDKLSKTTKPLIFKDKKIEAEKVRDEIGRLEREHSDIMKEVKEYILN